MMAQKVLVKGLIPTLRKTDVLPWISNWFFVRYWAQVPQLRFRVLVSSIKVEEIKALLESRLEPYLGDHQLWAKEWKSYVPELERYGVTNMDAVEELFRWQSEHALQLFQEKRGEENRLAVMLDTLSQLLKATHPTLRQRHAFIKMQRAYFGCRIQFSAHSKNAISKAYRKLAPSITLALGSAKNTSLGLTAPTKNMIGLLANIQGKTELETSRILRDIFHMAINKCFLTDHDQWEFLIYEYLDRAYTSHVARGKEQ